MSQLIKKPELASELREYLEKQADEGHQWVVYDSDNPISGQWDLNASKASSMRLISNGDTSRYGTGTQLYPSATWCMGLKK